MKTKIKAVERDIKSFKPEDQKDIIAVRSVLADNKEAYVRILERYRPHLVQRYFLKVKDHDVAEDLAAELLTKVYEKLALYRATHTFNSWFYMVADNFLKDWSRKAEWKFRMSSVSYNNTMSDGEGSIGAFVDSIADPSATADSTVLDRERKKAIRQGLATLDENGRKLIAMFYGKEMSYEEIAVEMGMNANTMKVHLMRAKHKLAEYVSRFYPEFEMQPMAVKSFSGVTKEKVIIDGEEHVTYFAA